jgi:hypothetical protein
VKLKIPIVFWLSKKDDIAISIIIPSNDDGLLIDGGNRGKGGQLLQV